MLRHLLATSAAIAISAPAAAETISTAVTQAVKTSTVKAGSPDAITISSAGSVKPASGTAVTMDSNHSVTNQGTIAISNSDGAMGIRVLGGLTGDVSNSGTITIDETYTTSDNNNDGDLDGAFALGQGRYGIRTEGALTGNVSHTGTITVEGNNSAGLWLGGALSGNLVHEGTTTVTGDNAIGLQAQSVGGNLRLAGTITVTGVGAVGARLAGDVAGTLVVQSSLSSTGYRYTSQPSNAPSLDADDLLQGGSALIIEGNAAKGIVLAIPPKDNSKTDNDEDKDGIDDSKEGSASVRTFGAAPAMLVGSATRDITIGAVPGTSNGHGLQIDGSVIGSGVYAGVDGNGLQVGGRGGAVNVAGGIHVNGTVSASSNGATATALRLGSKATTPEVRVAGTVSAAGNSARGVVVDAGANLPALKISGTVRTEAKAGGVSTAISDASGTLLLVENAGTISATGAIAGSNVAIDLSSTSSGTTVKQTIVTTNTTGPSITGDLRFGAGNDVLDIADGTVKGDAFFGAGANRMQLSGDATHTGKAVFGSGADVLSLAGTSVFSGTADFGGGADQLQMSGSARFSGSLANAGGLAVTMTGGTLALSTPATISSLTMHSGSVFAVTLDKDAGQGTMLNVTGTASFAAGSSLAITLGDVNDAEGRFVVLNAGSISGLSNLTAKADTVPFLFKATIATNAAPNTIAIDVTRRTTTELGLNASGKTAFPAVFAAISADDDVEALFLGLKTGATFRAAARQLLPDHAGGTFEGISLGARALARQVADPQSPVYSLGGLDILLSAAAWDSSKAEGSTASYDLGGLGFSLAAEGDTAIGAIGAQLSWLWNQHDQGGDVNRVESDTYDIAGYWRGKWGGLATHARASIGRASMRGRRTLSGAAGSKTITRNAIADWGGTLMTAMAGASYEIGGGGVFLRPSVTADYIRLKEDGHTSTGGGKALDLTVNARTSDEFAVNGGVAAGFDLAGRRKRDRNWFRIEGEGGWREVVGGSLGDTVAKFGSGSAFTLAPEQTASGWYARARAIGGTRIFEFGGEAGAEQRHSGTAITLRGTMRLGF